MSVVQLDAAKTFLNITTTGNDTELQTMLDRAEAVLTRRVGPLAPVTVTDEVHTGPGPLVLRRYPTISVTSATSDGQAVDDLDLDADTGQLFGTFTAAHRATTVTYQAGRATLPLDLEAAVLELTKHLWQSQRGSAPGLPLQGPGEADIDAPRYLLPYRVQTLIEPYLLPVFA